MDGAHDFYRDEDYGDDDIVEVLPPVIGGDERRLHVRAFNHWASLLEGRAYPSIRDLDPASIADFESQSVLLDFTAGVESPGIAYLGHALREESGVEPGLKNISEVPRGSLLSRLTDHYLQIIANRAPVGFEAEFTNAFGLPTLYRGILMPFSSDAESIDYVYGVINWKHAVSPALAGELQRQMEQVAEAPQRPAPASVWDAPVEKAPDQPLGDTSGLWDWLAAARISAETARSSEGRAHAALYEAIGRAYDFALFAEACPADYAELIEDEGLTVQARAPMTPIVKLVFGLGYDKTRLTEYAAALAYARRQNLGRGELASFLESFDGGLKGVVRAERSLRSPSPVANRLEQARSALRTAEARLVIPFDAGDQEFVLLVARRAPGGQVAILGAVDDPALVERALRKAAA